MVWCEGGRSSGGGSSEEGYTEMTSEQVPEEREMDKQTRAEKDKMRIK